MPRVFAVIAGAFLAMTVQTGVAQTAFPSEGKFAVTYTFTTTTPATPIDVGGGQDLTVNRYLATMVNDEGKGFLHLAAGRCTNIRFTNRADRTVDTNAYCNFRDSDGDTLYVRYSTGTPKPANAIVNTWTLMSDTGKFAGIQGGGIDINSNNLSDSGSYQAIGKLSGSYKIVRPPPPAASGSRN